MAFSLGSLFVELKANTAQFLDGMTKAGAYASKTGRDIERGLGKVGEILSPLGQVGERIASMLDGVGGAANRAFSSIGKIGGSLGLLAAGAGGVTALGGAMFALADHASEVGAKLFEASEKTGISAAQMSGLMALTKETQGDFDGLAASVAKAGVNLEKGIIDPGGEAGKVLSQVMGSSKALTDLGLKPMGDRIQVVLSRIFAMHDAGERNVSLSALMGRGWQQNLSALKILAEQGYGPAIEQAKKFGVFFDTDAAAQAKQFQSSLAILKNEVASLGMAIGEKAVPAFAAMARGLQSLGADLRSSFWGASAVVMALTGNLLGAKKAWAEHEKAVKDADQTQTDFMVHLQNLATGEKASEDGTKKLTGAVKEHRDVLADIIRRENDELEALSTTGSKQREAQREYQRTTAEIQKAVAAGGSYAESLKAQSLALDVYRKKLMEIPPVIPKGYDWQAKPTQPGLQMPGLPAGWFSSAAPQQETLAQLAKLPMATDNVRFAERALRMETELSAASFCKLAAAFPGLTEGEVAATAAGRRMIEQLTRMDRLGNVTQQFTAMKDTLILEGEDLGGHLVRSLGGAIEGIEDQLARLAVTGKANFKSLFQGIGEQVAKAGMQKGVSVLLGSMHLGGGLKRDGATAQAALYVTPVNDSGKPLGGIGGIMHSLAGGKADSAFGDTASGSKLWSNVASIGKSFMGTFGGAFSRMFGGYMAEGGDVTPGKAYMVGERHPEWFVPGRSGQIVPSLSVQQMRPLVYSPTFNVSTPNADSFRRTQAQLLSEGYRTMALTHARHS